MVYTIRTTFTDADSKLETGGILHGRSVCHTVALFVVGNVLASIFLAMGIIHLDKCTAQPLIPIYITGDLTSLPTIANLFGYVYLCGTNLI